jgi:hypothetical protein
LWSILATVPLTTTNAISTPVWVRVPGIIALVLVGVLLSTILLGATNVVGTSDDHGPGNETGTTDHGSPSETDRGGHGSGDGATDHRGSDSE